MESSGAVARSAAAAGSDELVLQKQETAVVEKIAGAILSTNPARFDRPRATANALTVRVESEEQPGAGLPVAETIGAGAGPPPPPKALIQGRDL
jgi:hypothetical protein